MNEIREHVETIETNNQHYLKVDLDWMADKDKSLREQCEVYTDSYESCHKAYYEYEDCTSYDNPREDDW